MSQKPLLDYGTTPSAGGISWKVEPSGAVNIEIRPQGIKRIMRLESTATVGGVLICILLGILGPICGALWAWRPVRGEIIWLIVVPPLLIGAAAIPIAILFSKTRRHVRLYADADRLSIWAGGPMDPQAFEWRRADIVNVEAKWVETSASEYGDSRKGGLMVHTHTKTDVFLDCLRDEEVKNIAVQLRKALKLALGSAPLESQ